MCYGTELSDLGQWERSQGHNKHSGFQVLLRAMLKIISPFLKINDSKHSGCIKQLFLQTSSWVLKFFRIA